MLHRMSLKHAGLVVALGGLLLFVSDGAGASVGTSLSYAEASSFVGGTCADQTQDECWIPFLGCASNTCFWASSWGDWFGTTSAPVTCGGSCGSVDTVFRYCNQ